MTRHCGTCCLKNLSPMRCASARFMICIPRGHARRLHHSTHYSDIISTLPSRSWHFKSSGLLPRDIEFGTALTTLKLPYTAFLNY